MKPYDTYALNNLVRMLVIAAVAGSAQAWAVFCPVMHCTKFQENPQTKPHVLKACANSKGNVVVPYGDGFCDCPCSCYGTGAFLSSSDGDVEMENLSRGGSILTAAGPQRIHKVLRSEVNNYPAVRVAFDNGNDMVLSENHAVVLKGYLVAHAESLRPGMQVLGKNDEPVTVTSVTPTKYTGVFHNVLLSGRRSDGKDRIVYSSGIQSGDWWVQSYRDRVHSNTAIRALIKQLHTEEKE